MRFFTQQHTQLRSIVPFSDGKEDEMRWMAIAAPPSNARILFYYFA